MSIATACAVSVLGVSLGCGARARSTDPPPRAPTANDIVLGHSAEVRALLADVHDARSEIAFLEPEAARELVAEATAIAARIAHGRAYALLDDETGTLQQLSSASDTAFMKAFDQVSEQQLLDLRATRLELDYARILLASGKLAEAGHRLARIDGAVWLRRTITPDRNTLVVENVKIALRDAAAGDWPAAGVAFEAARRDAALSPGPPRVVFSTLPAAATTPTL